MSLSVIIVIGLVFIVLVFIVVMLAIRVKDLNQAQLNAHRVTQEQIFDKKIQESQFHFSNRQKELDNTVSPIELSLKELRGKIEQIEKDRLDSFATLNTHIRSLYKETSTLSQALRKPEVRGKWGELQLKRVLEIAGMQEYCDFDLQKSVTTSENKALRPDVIIKMPDNKEIVIDSKVPLEAYLESLNTDSPELQEQKLKHHAEKVKERVKELSRKSYWEQFKQSPDFVILFLPSENLFSSALDYDPTLIEYGFENKVIIATPTTLIALLKAVAYGWKQKSLEDNSKKIAELGLELYNRMATMGGYFFDLGKSLNTAVNKYNDTMSSLESRVLPSARKLKDYGLSSSSEIKDLERVHTEAQRISEKMLITNNED